MKIIINIGWATMFFATVITAQDYTLPLYSVTSGGGNSAGGSFQMVSSIGQPDAGATMSGGPFDVDGGLLPGVDEEEILLGDINLDGSVNLLDVAPFVELISNGEFQAEADINQDGEVNLLDVVGFVELLTG